MVRTSSTTPSPSPTTGKPPSARSSETTAPRVCDVPIDQIDRSRNHRIERPGDDGRVAALTASIKAAGQLQPVRVYECGPQQKKAGCKQPYVLGFGDRRCRALLALGRKTVRAVVFGPVTDAEIEQARAIENLHRQDITPLEEVRAVDALLKAVKADRRGRDSISLASLTC